MVDSFLLEQLDKFEENKPLIRDDKILRYKKIKEFKILGDNMYNSINFDNTIDEQIFNQYLI
jgi:hypothetical protein